MPSTIQFLREPRYTDAVVFFILAPAGVQYDTKDIGNNLFGALDWTEEALIIDGLSRRPGFRYAEISFHWTDFLDLAFRHVDHALFYIPDKRTFKEIRQESLLQQNPDLYSFSFHKFICEARKGMLLPPPEPEIPLLAPIVATTPQPKIIPEARSSVASAGATLGVPAGPPVVALAQQKRSANGRMAAPEDNRKKRQNSGRESTLVDERLVSIDIDAFSNLLDRLGRTFSESLKELRELRSLLDR